MPDKLISKLLDGDHHILSQKQFTIPTIPNPQSLSQFTITKSPGLPPHQSEEPSKHFAFADLGLGKEVLDQREDWELGEWGWI